QQTSPAIFGHGDVRLGEFFSIPELARDLAVGLIERFAIIGVSAAAYFLSPPEFHFAKPIGIGEGLTRHADHVCIFVLQNRFSLCECCDAASGDDRRVESGGIYRAFDLRYQRYRSTEWAALVGQSCRHAFITALARVRVDG